MLRNKERGLQIDLVLKLHMATRQDDIENFFAGLSGYLKKVITLDIVSFPTLFTILYFHFLCSMYR